MESMVTRARRRYMRYYLTLGNCYLIMPAPMEKAQKLGANIYFQNWDSCIANSKLWSSDSIWCGVYNCVVLSGEHDTKEN